MRRFATTLLCAAAALAACGGGNPWPAGWQQAPGSTSTWTDDAPGGRQTYTYSKERYAGNLQDLAQREIADAALRDRSVKLVKSDVFAPCPGVAAIATFAGGVRTVQDAFSAAGGNAVVVRYERPSAAQEDPAAVAAMKRALCVAP